MHLTLNGLCRRRASRCRWVAGWATISRSSPQSIPSRQHQMAGWGASVRSSMPSIERVWRWHEATREEGRRWLCCAVTIPTSQLSSPPSADESAGQRSTYRWLLPMLSCKPLPMMGCGGCNIALRQMLGGWKRAPTCCLTEAGATQSYLHGNSGACLRKRRAIVQNRAYCSSTRLTQATTLLGLKPSVRPTHVVNNRCLHGAVVCLAPSICQGGCDARLARAGNPCSTSSDWAG